MLDFKTLPEDDIVQVLMAPDMSIAEEISRYYLSKEYWTLIFYGSDMRSALVLMQLDETIDDRKAVVRVGCPVQCIWRDARYTPDLVGFLFIKKSALPPKQLEVTLSRFSKDAEMIAGSGCDVIAVTALHARSLLKIMDGLIKFASRQNN